MENIKKRKFKKKERIRIFTRTSINEIKKKGNLFECHLFKDEEKCEEM